MHAGADRDPQAGLCADRAVPEIQALRQGPWTDVYALCALLYHAVTGRKPMPSVGRLVHDELVPAATSQPGVAARAFCARSISAWRSSRRTGRSRCASCARCSTARRWSHRDPAGAAAGVERRNRHAGRGTASERRTSGAARSGYGAAGGSHDGACQKAVRATDRSTRRQARRAEHPIAVAATAAILVGTWYFARPGGIRAIVPNRGGCRCGAASCHGRFGRAVQRARCAHRHRAGRRSRGAGRRARRQVHAADRPRTAAAARAVLARRLCVHVHRRHREVAPLSVVPQPDRRQQPHRSRHRAIAAAAVVEHHGGRSAGSQPDRGDGVAQPA